MNISPHRAGQSRLKTWFYNKERTPGVIGSSPADNLRDMVSIAASTAAVAGASAATVTALGAGALAATALAVPLAVAGAVGGALIASVSQEAAGALLRTERINDEGGMIVGGGVTGALVGAGGAIAAGFGAAPLAIALGGVGALVGLTALAGLGARAFGG